MNDLGHNIAVVEAMAIDRGDRATLDLVQQRECLTSGAGLAIVQLEMCRAQVEMEAHALAQEIIREGDQSIQGLRDLFTGSHEDTGPHLRPRDRSDLPAQLRAGDFVVREDRYGPWRLPVTRMCSANHRRINVTP